MSSDFAITSARLRLRPLRPSDSVQLTPLLNDYEVARWLTVVPHPYEHSDFDAFLSYLTDRPTEAALAIEVEGQPIGVIGLDPGLGFWLGRGFHGQGYMTEAASALITWAFSQPDRHQVTSGYFDGNGASARVHKKLGFRETGAVEFVNSIAQGVDVNIIRLSLQREDWSARI